MINKEEVTKRLTALFFMIIKSNNFFPKRDSVQTYCKENRMGDSAGSGAYCIIKGKRLFRDVW